MLKTWFERSPLHFFTKRSNVCEILSENADPLFFFVMHAEVISGSQTFFIITCFVSFLRCLSYDDAIFLNVFAFSKQVAC